MAVGCLPEELQAWASKADADRQQQATEADEGQQRERDASQAAAAEGANDPAQPTWIARHPLKLRSAYNEVGVPEDGSAGVEASHHHLSRLNSTIAKVRDSWCVLVVTEI